MISRPNRFIMMVRANRKTLRCHCPTTGRLGNLKLEGMPCLYSVARNNKRKTGYTVEAISTSRSDSSWVGINQTAVNRYFEFFVRNGALPRIAMGDLRREVRLGRSRIDFLAGDTYLEVKMPLISLSATEETPRVTQSRFDSFDRLIRHMGVLRGVLVAGKKAAIVLCYLYDAKPFRPPRPDKTNRKILTAARRAQDAGVQRWQVNMKIDRNGVSLIRYFRRRPYS